MSDKNKIYLKAEIKIEKETKDLKEKASTIIPLPSADDKQHDLLYFSAIFVSSGENLNHAFFLGSELVAAENTIVNKALDIEHSESDIIGHIYDRAFVNKEGETLNIDELSSSEKASLDKEDMHVAIAGIIYKNRFPDIAEEVANKKWKVSMECYYSNYDIKVGNLILDKKEADFLGLAHENDKLLGRMASILKDGKEIAKGTVARVLRGICFSGCGIVKDPANPPSIILETAKEKEIVIESNTDDVIVFDYNKEKSNESNENNKVTVDKVEGTVIEEKIKKDNVEKARDGLMDDTSGICISYKRRVYDKAGAIISEDWCSAYDTGCTSFSRDTTDPECLRNKDIRRFAKAYLKKLIKKRAQDDRREILIKDLTAALQEAVKTKSS